MTAKEGAAMPETITLSENAVAVFRLRVKGLRMPPTERRLPAYRELVEAGIMEPDGEGFGFTAKAWERREELLREAEDRIERERYDPPDTSNLSEVALALLRRIAPEERVEVTKANRPAFRELAAARIIVLCHSFAHRDESGYQFTYYGWHRRFEILDRAKEPAR
jgi:hypothetical protein